VSDSAAPPPRSPAPLPDFTKWPSFPFEGALRVKHLQEPVAVEPPREGEDANDCVACSAPDEAYIWVSERWRVRTMDRPSGLPVVLILETRSHLDLGDLPNLLAAELGVMTVRLERAIRSLDGVARVHVNRWGDGSAHMHLWFLARPYGRLQLRGTFLSLWDDILPAIPESRWRENLALVAAWLAEFGGRPLAEPPRFEWQAPSNLADQASAGAAAAVAQGRAGAGPVVAAAASVGGGTTARVPELPHSPAGDTAATEGPGRSDNPPADVRREVGDANDARAAAAGSVTVSPSSGPALPRQQTRPRATDADHADADHDDSDDEGWEDPEPYDAEIDTPSFRRRGRADSNPPGPAAVDRRLTTAGTARAAAPGPPAPERPASGAPGPERPASGAPAAEQPAAEQPAAEQPAAEAPHPG
jgi:diadenosine tetraphosphate (Ap4A) HIT family hydrolase